MRRFASTFIGARKSPDRRRWPSALSALSALLAALVALTCFAARPAAAFTGRTLSIGSVIAPEGNSGPTTFTFTFTLDGPAVGDESVQIDTTDGNATVADNDYESVSNHVVTFAAGSTLSVLDVIVNGDTTFESSETFSITASNAQNVALGNGVTGNGSIVNDDPEPGVRTTSVSDVTVAEGNSGTQAMKFFVSMTPPAIGDETLDLNTADGTAGAGSDYNAIPGLHLTFTPGQTGAFHHRRREG